MKRIYLDNCANTPVAPEVIEAMTAALATGGNPSSIHHEGRRAHRMLTDARTTVAGSIGAKAAEIVFCGSGTEANNLAIGGLISKSIRETGRARVITSPVEHASIRTRLAWEKRLHKDALEVIEIGVSANGGLRIDQLSTALTPDTTLAAFLLVNNETGIVQDIDALKQQKLTHPKVPFLLDAVQAQGKILLDVRLLPFDLLSFSAHKIYGPAGIGALFVRGGLELDPLVFGGSQEKFRHAGTENLAGIAGYAEAVNLLPPPDQTNRHLAQLETVFLEELGARAIKLQLNGPQNHHPAATGPSRLPGFINLSFENVADRGDLQIALDLAGVSLSSTSACHSGVTEESHVLRAMGITGDRLSGAIRLLFSRYHTGDDARAAAAIMADVAARIADASTTTMA